jgi:serine/threonine-protein kinase
VTARRIGKYLVEKVLGRGSMGVVYLARDPNIDRLVAVKCVVIPPGIDEEKVQEYRERFLREARAAGRLNHPSIVTIYEADSGQWGGAPFIAMEFIEGIPWNLRTRRGPAPDVDRAADLARQIASALDYAHRSGVVHRDIKPANIIETADGRAKLMDFGIAKVPTSELTREGQFLGTPAYMSPEQVMGKPVDGRSDLFSLGSVLYEVLSGQKPFTGEDIPSVIHKILSHDPQPAGTFNRGVPEELEVILCHLLAKDPADRYTCAGEVVEDLDAYLAGGRPPHAGHRMADERAVVPAPPLFDPAPAQAEDTVSSSKSPASPALPEAPPPAAHTDPPVPPEVPLLTPTPAAPAISRPPSPAHLHFLASRMAMGLAVCGSIVLLAALVAWFVWTRHPPLGAPPPPGLPQEEAIAPPEHLLAEAPKPRPVVPVVLHEEETAPAVAPTAPAPEPVKVAAACTVSYSFTTGIVSGEFWIRVDGEIVKHQVVDRDFSFKGETYTGSFKVPAGTRTLSVQVKTNRQNVDSTWEEKVEFPDGGSKNLKIIMTKMNKKIRFEWQ